MDFQSEWHPKSSKGNIIIHEPHLYFICNPCFNANVIHVLMLCQGYSMWHFGLVMCVSYTKNNNTIIHAVHFVPVLAPKLGTKWTALAWFILTTLIAHKPCTISQIWECFFVDAVCDYVSSQTLFIMQCVILLVFHLNGNYKQHRSMNTLRAVK